METRIDNQGKIRFLIIQLHLLPTQLTGAEQCTGVLISGTIWSEEENRSSKESFLGHIQKVLFFDFICLTVLGLRSCAGFSLVVVCGLLLAVASLDTEHRL